MEVDGVVQGSNTEVSAATTAASTPAPTESKVSTPKEAAQTVTSSPAAQKAREAIDNARKSIFETKKEGKTEEKQASAAPAKGEKEVVVEPPKYTPNYKYKVEGQEKEFDDEIKKLITSENVEKKIRQLYADAEGIVATKAFGDRMKQGYQEATQKLGALDTDLKRLGHHLHNDDLDSFFEELKYSPDRVFKWVEKKLALMQATPEQQAEYDRTRQLSKQTFELSQENTQFKSREEFQTVQARTYELDSELLKPEVNQIAQAYDARVGKTGAFREECMNRGLLAWQRAKKDISAVEAVQQMMSLVGTVVPPQQAAGLPSESGQQPGQASPGQNVVAPQRPVIPIVSGHSTSPVKSAPRNLDDLRKLAKNARQANV